MKELEVYSEAIAKIESSDVLAPDEMLRLLDLTPELKHEIGRAHV